MNFRFKIVIIALLTTALTVNAQKDTPKNIILIVANGMTSDLVAAAMLSSGDQLAIARFEQTGYAIPWLPDGKMPPVAAISNAIACGEKTSNNYVGLNRSGDSAATILEIARSMNMATCIITTSDLTDPSLTPFYAHNKSSENYSSIAGNLVNSKTDVIIGGGMKHFSGVKGHEDLLFSFRKEGYKIIDEYKNMGKSADKQVAAIISQAEVPSVKVGRGSFLQDAWIKAFKSMVKSKKGFFILIANPHIEWAAKLNDADYMIKEVMDLDGMIMKIADMVGNDKETLILVVGTSDAGAVSITGTNPKNGMPEIKFNNSNYNPALIPVFAHGPGATVFSGIYDNTRIFFKLKNLIIRGTPTSD